MKIKDLLEGTKKTSKLEVDLAFLQKNLKRFVKKSSDGLTSEDHPNALPSIFGDLTGEDNHTYSINAFSPNTTGKYTLEVSKNGGKTIFFVDENHNAQTLVWSIKNILED